MLSLTKPHIFGAAFLLLALYACSGATSPPVATQSDGGRNSAGTSQRLHPQATPTPIAITVETGSGGSTAIPLQLLGANQVTYFNFDQSYVSTALNSAGLTLLRFPGGGFADHYHWNGLNWENPVEGQLAPTDCEGKQIYSTFDGLMSTIPSTASAAITVNYGSNAQCTAGGLPGEAAAWVTYAKQYYPGRVNRWTVGNEVYNPNEYDLNTPLPGGSPDPALYSTTFSKVGGYYRKMKNADSTAQVGISVKNEKCCDTTAWNYTAMSQAFPYDFVEEHYYAWNPANGNVTDDYTLGQGVAGLDTAVSNVQQWLAHFGYSSTPIYVGELNSSLIPLTKQTVSIVNGLFAGMSMAELSQASVSSSEDNANVAAATWYNAIDGACNKDTSGDPVYGWQDFGTFSLFSDGSSNCDNIPAGTLFPTGRIFQALANDYFQSGSLARTVNCAPCTASSSPPVRAYAITRGSGYAILLFNLVDTNGAQPQDVTITVDSLRSKAFSATGVTYGKNEYDKTKNGNSNPANWVGPSALTPFNVTPNQAFTITLNPWSMTIIDLQ